MHNTAKFKTTFQKCPFREESDQYPDLTFVSFLIKMSILDVSKCKNSYITSILDNKKSVDDPKDTANMFNNFLANVPQVNHSPSFYLRVNYSESIYFSVTSHKNLDFYRLYECQEVFRSIQCTCHYFENYQRLYMKPLAFLINASFTSGNFPDKLKLSRIIPIFKKGSRFDKDN